MLRIESLSITLGEFSVRDVSLEIRSNEYFIILGPTGAGKTVLLETIAGIHTPGFGENLPWRPGDHLNRTTLAEYRDGIPGLHALPSPYG